MNSEPCVRFGMRISPKISEKPADSRNSSPPNVMLLTASTSQKVMCAEVPRLAMSINAAGAVGGARGVDRRYDLSGG